MFKSKKRLIILLLLLFIPLFIMSYQKKSHPSLNEIFVYPFDLINGVTSYIYNSFSNVSSAIEENDRLNKRMAELLIERQSYSEIMLENKRLRAILALKENNPAFYMTARAVARGYDRLLNILIVDKGKEHGIIKNMAVITTNGLVGKIYTVREKYSEVLLLNDPNFSVAVRLQNSRHEGIVAGTGRRHCLLKYIPPEESVEKDDLVITSGLDGIFPQGIPVGIVNHIAKEGTDFFQYLEVIPFQSDSKVEEVIILKPFTDKALRRDSK